MRLDVFTPSNTETNDVKRPGTVRPSHPRQTDQGHETPGAWTKERPMVSSMGLLMRELHGIKNDDPQAFTRVTATISERLHSLAQEESPESAERLVAMAERFERASLQGDLSPLRSERLPYAGQVLRGPWAYRQTSELQEVRADVQAVIGAALDEYANASAVSPTTGVSTPNADTPTQSSGTDSENVVAQSSE